MLLLRLSLFVSLVLVVQISAIRPRRQTQTCECTAAEPPKCGCQMVPSPYSPKGFQMVCSCSPPSTPKCVCKDTKTVPPPQPAVIAVTKPTNSKCAESCKNSCYDTCSKMPGSSKCSEMCDSACDFSCAKQDLNKGSGTKQISEFKFIIPTDSKPAPPVQVQLPPPAFLITNEVAPPRPTAVVVAPKKVCEAACMPECSFACTTFKPALKLVTQVIEGNAPKGEDCQRTCGETCLKVCSSTGLSLRECANNCDVACQESCGVLSKQNIIPSTTCVAQCMPSCSVQCVDMHNEILTAFQIKPPTPQPQLPAAVVISTDKSAQLTKLCQNECSVQCEQQCGVNSLAGPQCLAACQTTCYPVCQAKMRRKHLRSARNEEENES